MAAGLPAIVLSSHVDGTTRRCLRAFQALGRCKTRSTRLPCTSDPLSTVHLSESTGSKAAIGQTVGSLPVGFCRFYAL